MHPYIQPLSQALASSAEPDRALQMKKYLKDQFGFFGVSSEGRKSIVKEHILRHGLPELPEIDTIARELWNLEEREYQMVLIELMDRMKKKLEPAHLPLLEYLITHKSWWDSVDAISAWLVGDLFRRHPELIGTGTSRWMGSGNIWLQRSCLLFQLKYKKDTDTRLLFGFMLNLAEHKSFWIRKAIGWTLREYSKTDPETVKNFVSLHPELSGLSKREALKHINRL